MWKLFLFISKILSFIPNPLFRFFWRLLDIFDGKFGALLRYLLIAKRLKKCGTKVYFGNSVYIESPHKLSLGKNISIHHQCTLICSGEIEIHDDVSIAHSSSIVSTNHTWQDLNVAIKYNPVVGEKITIQNDVWIGCGVRILAGVIIPSRSIIAAGAVVTKKLTDTGSLYGGIPAKKIRDI